jgi:hypothetical protein
MFQTLELISVTINNLIALAATIFESRNGFSCKIQFLSNQPSDSLYAQYSCRISKTADDNLTLSSVRLTDFLRSEPETP